MKSHTFNKFNIAGLILAAIARAGFSESTRIRRVDPEKQAAAEAKRMFRRQRNLFIQSRGGYRD